MTNQDKIILRAKHIAEQNWASAEDALEQYIRGRPDFVEHLIDVLQAAKDDDGESMMNLLKAGNAFRVIVGNLAALALGEVCLRLDAKHSEEDE